MTMTDDLPVPVILTAESYAAWRTHPATQAFMTYLGDYADAIERLALERWRRGPWDADYESEGRGRVATLRELIELTPGDIIGFYAEPAQIHAEDNDANARPHTE